jgi:hypothetical protein
MSYARIFLATFIAITAVFYLLGIPIAAIVFGLFTLFVLFVVIKEGL